ncbi:unnamed protein product [Neofusicoccum parvum]|uniref:Unnamed protein product n=1 Tax=Neofusicoccum parvum TaxID=310453 RepID=A0ACB5SMX4_9PEZI|nr:unnamed protein product [Neofusicoccum parvum]
MSCKFILSILSSVLSARVIASLPQPLPQDITNGGSNLGTLDAPYLPDFLTSNPLPDGFPWGNRNGQNDPFCDPPNTGVTRYYDFTVARGHLLSDGFNKSGIYVNGQFPGPAIEANWGDWIEVRVHNNITGPEEGTSLHWHGILQKGTQWYDGVPGVTQCPIAPGSSFTYRFRADVYGTSWWHSHFSAQYTMGVFGPLTVYGPKYEEYDIDVGPVMLGDYFHSDYTDVLKNVTSNSSDFSVYVPGSDNNLINGKNNFNCSNAAPGVDCVPNAGLPQFRFQPGKIHRLRLMNVGASGLQHFSIDGHKMKIIAQDFEPLVPYEADFVTLGAAQRTDVLVTADADPQSTYWIRSTISKNCTAFAKVREAFAILSYEGNDDINLPTTVISDAAAAADEKGFLCKNDDLEKTVPLFPKEMDPEPDMTLTVLVELFTNYTGHHVFTMNNISQWTNYNDPVLSLANQKNFSYPNPKWNVYNMGGSKTVRIVLNTNYESPHPMHLHGHSFQVLSEGPGSWNGTIVNPQNPARRDTHIQRIFGHLVIQFETDNPGIWSYHCHIAWHASMGLNMQIVERPYELQNVQIPMVMEQTCKDWNAWTDDHVVDQIDAGI